MKILLKISTALLLIIGLSSFNNVVKHRRYNYYKLVDKEMGFDFFTLAPADTLSEYLPLNCLKAIKRDQAVFFALQFSGYAFSDRNLDRPMVSYTNMQAVLPIDTIIQISLAFTTHKNKVLNIPYKFIHADDYKWFSLACEGQYTPLKSPTTTVRHLEAFKTLYNSRDTLISCEALPRQVMLCELDLQNVDFSRLKKRRIIAQLTIKLSSGRKLSMKKSIPVQ